jgi:hypothetical protein
VWFRFDNVALDVAQALCAALVGAGLPAWLLRLAGRGWALIAPLSIALTIAAISVLPGTADVLALVALVLVPPGCALALGWAARGARPPLAVVAVALLAVATASPESTAGQLARVALIVGSVVTVGRLLAGAVPPGVLELALVAMAAVDSVLVFSELFQAQFSTFGTAAPPAGLPQLQVAELGTASLQYGDFFAAGVVGGVLAAERRPQLAAAAALLVASLAFDQLFLVVDTLPATVPPAVVLVVARRVGGSRPSRRPPPRRWAATR